MMRSDLVLFSVLLLSQMFKRYEKKGFPSAFSVRSKCIALFQTIKGVDVILFAMYVYEYGDSCPPPNRRRVYISYLDSVSYFEPKCYRTIAYHGIIMEYLRYVKERGFHSAHIWSCPPSPDDEYVFYSHPKDQLIPSEAMLREWYQCMLDKAKAEGIVLETRTLYDEYFKNNGMDATSCQAVDPTCLPYFEGDYIPGETENIIKEVKVGEEAKRKERLSEIAGLELNKKTGNKKGTRSNPGELVEWSQDKVMLRLGQAIYNMRENFMVVRLRSKAFASAVDGGEDVTGWVDVEGNEDSLSNKRFKISGKAGSSSLFQLPFYHKSESGCTSSTDRDSTICESERGATVAADDADKSVASAAAPKGSALALGDGADSSHPVEAAPSNREEAALPNDNKEEPRQRGAIPKMSNVQSVPQAQDGVGDASHAKIDLRDDASGLRIWASEAAKLDGGADESRPSESASKDNLASQYSDENTSNEPTAAIAIGTEESQPSTLASKGEEQQSKGSSKRGFDEIETTLSRHLALVRCTAKPVGSTMDEDEPHETEMFESRQQFLNYCQTNHFQFDELRRAKHSTMMILFQLHNPSAPMFLQQCGACYRDITHGIRYHCNHCSNFDLCHECYEPVRTGLWAKRDSRFTHDKRHTFVAIDMEGPADTQKSRDERARTIKMHLELLSHAATCNGPPSCSLNNCQRMKKLFEHVESCEVTYKQGCKICSRLLALLTMHARMCTVRGSCPLPFCDRIRERNRRREQQQQLMDDRRRQAQNELYRDASTS
jgi:E1A/CREB-binding protein